MRNLLDSEILAELYEPSSKSQPILLARSSALKDADVAVVSILAIDLMLAATAVAERCT